MFGFRYRLKDVTKIIEKMNSWHFLAAKRDGRFLFSSRARRRVLETWREKIESCLSKSIRAKTRERKKGTNEQTNYYVVHTPLVLYII